jgi:hypothetical protein
MTSDIIDNRSENLVGVIRRVAWDGLKTYQSAREETSALTEEAVRVEREIDEMVKNLYGV